MSTFYTILIVIALQILAITSHQLSLKSWMHQLQQINNHHITDINIPGTHETMSKRGGISGDWAICSAFTVTEQLNMGYRFFDIRVKVSDDNVLGIYHAMITQQSTWNDLHQKLVEFLKGAAGAAGAAGPISANECIILKVKDEAKKKKPDEFGQPFANKINEYNNDADARNHIYFFRQANQIEAPTLGDCAGKVIILHDGLWGLSKHWRNLYPWMWIDENPGKGDDKTAYNANGKSATHEHGRIQKWKNAMAATNTAGADTEFRRFWRNGLNTNSKSGNKATLVGKPKQWAKIMNPLAYDYIKDNSFPAGATCVDKFYGAVVIDIPVDESETKATEMPIITILSNCDLHNWITVAKDFNQFPQLVTQVVAARLSRSNMMQYNDEKYKNEKRHEYIRKRFRYN